MKHGRLHLRYRLNLRRQLQMHYPRGEGQLQQDIETLYTEMMDKMLDQGHAIIDAIAANRHIDVQTENALVDSDTALTQLAFHLMPHLWDMCLNFNDLSLGSLDGHVDHLQRSFFEYDTAQQMRDEFSDFCKKHQRGYINLAHATSELVPGSTLERRFDDIVHQIQAILDRFEGVIAAFEREKRRVRMHARLHQIEHEQRRLRKEARRLAQRTSAMMMTRFGRSQHELGRRQRMRQEMQERRQR